METEEPATRTLTPEIEARIVALREAGASWKELGTAFGMTRQQVRYGYQRGKRTERRAARRSGDSYPPVS